MPFLASVLANVVEWLLGKLAAYGAAWIRFRQKKAADEVKTQQNTDTLMDAKTKEERQSANQNLNNTLGEP